MTHEDLTTAIRRKVEAFSTRLHARDPSVVDLVWSSGFRLVGSEAGEVAASPEALRDLFTGLYARPVRHAFDFTTFVVDGAGDVCWLFAEGDLVMTGDDAVTRLPYRLTAVFEREGDDWRWRLFSGAEPAPPVGPGH